jgi:hypothetical protein
MLSTRADFTEMQISSTRRYCVLCRAEIGPQDQDRAVKRAKFLEFLIPTRNTSPIFLFQLAFSKQYSCVFVETDSKGHGHFWHLIFSQQINLDSAKVILINTVGFHPAVYSLMS